MQQSDIKIISIIFLACGVFSCKIDNKKIGEDDTLVNEEAFSQQLNIKEKNIELDPEARDYALKWVAYITAQNEIDRLEKSSVREIMQNADAISQIMQSLEIAVPDSLQSLPVKARLNVVSTKAQVLAQLSNRRKKDPKLIAQTAEDLHLEFNNLKLQMNELFLETLEDFEKELDKFEAEQDQQLFERDSIEKDSIGLENEDSLSTE